MHVYLAVLVQFDLARFCPWRILPLQSLEPVLSVATDSIRRTYYSTDDTPLLPPILPPPLKPPARMIRQSAQRLPPLDDEKSSRIHINNLQIHHVDHIEQMGDLQIGHLPIDETITSNR